MRYLVFNKDLKTWKSLTTKAAIWNSVEVNTAVLCGKDLLPQSLVSKYRLTDYFHEACLPCLRPIASIVSDRLSALKDRLKALRQRNKPVQQGRELLANMLPRRNQGEMFRSMQPHEALEIDTLYEPVDRTPQELDVGEHLLPELEAIGHEPIELALQDIGEV